MVRTKRKSSSDLQPSNKRLHTGAGAAESTTSGRCNENIKTAGPQDKAHAAQYSTPGDKTDSPRHDQPLHPAHQPPDASPSNSGILKILPRPAQLPPLPPVQQAALREQAFTHPGAVHGSDSRRVALSYDRLEFLGDAYIELVASRFLYDALPQLGAGRLSQVREQLVSNRTLADYACAYGFDARARLAAGLHEQQQQQRLQQQQREQQHGGGSGGGAGTQVKMYADIFEAYVAAVVLDEPATGFATAEAWLLSLWRPRVLGARQSAGDGSACAVGITGHISGSASGSGDVGSAGDAGASAGGRGGSGSAGSEDPRKDEPEPKQQLAVKVMSPGCRLEYELQPRKLAKGESPQDLVHTVHVYFTGYDKWTRQLLGTGAGPNKAVAGSRAATHALEHCALLDEIVACKAAYVAAK